MIVSDANKYVFISTPKTGTHSFFKLLPENWDGEQAEGPYHRREIPDEAANYYKFTTVRHPFSRTVSIWNSLTRNGPYPDIYLPLIGGESFDRFADWLINFDPWSLKSGKGRVLLFPQSRWHKNVPLDCALHIENVDQEFATLPFVPEGTSEKVPQLLARKYESWPELVTGDTKRKLTKWLEKDFRMFGYSPDEEVPPVGAARF